MGVWIVDEESRKMQDALLNIVDTRINEVLGRILDKVEKPKPTTKVKMIDTRRESYTLYICCSCSITFRGYETQVYKYCPMCGLEIEK